MAAKSYWEKLQDPRWQKKRLEILERDGWRCTECSDESKPLHVHHGYYEKGFDPWEYRNDTLRTLCEDCHKEIGALMNDVHRAIGALDSQFSLEAIGKVAALMNEMWAKSEEEQRPLAEACVFWLSFGTFCDRPWRNIPGPPAIPLWADYELDAQISSGIGVSA